MRGLKAIRDRAIEFFVSYLITWLILNLDNKSTKIFVFWMNVFLVFLSIRIVLNIFTILKSKKHSQTYVKVISRNYFYSELPESDLIAANNFLKRFWKYFAYFFGSLASTVVSVYIVVSLIKADNDTILIPLFILVAFIFFALFLHYTLQLDKLSIYKKSKKGVFKVEGNLRMPGYQPMEYYTNSHLGHYVRIGGMDLFAEYAKFGKVFDHYKYGEAVWATYVPGFNKILDMGEL